MVLIKEGLGRRTCHGGGRQLDGNVELGQKFMIQNLIQTRPGLGIGLQDHVNEIPTKRVYLSVFGERVLVEFDPLIGTLHVGGLKGRSTYQ